MPRRAINLWWTVVCYASGSFKKVSAVVALVCGTQPNGYGTNFGLNPRCQICTSFDEETFEHTIFQCDRLILERQRLVSDLKDSMPRNMWSDFERMSFSHRYKFLVSGLMCNSYMPEWKDIYLKISNLIHGLYRARALAYKQLND